eukprot:scaffold32181_cov71-Cyclotella_meneghiniana.AAC.2
MDSELSSSGSEDELRALTTKRQAKTPGKSDVDNFFDESSEKVQSKALNDDDDESIDSWATGKEGKSYVLRDTVAVKYDEPKQRIMVLCLWKGYRSDNPKDSTYQTLEDVRELHEGRLEKTDAIVNEWIDTQHHVIDVRRIKMKSKQEFIAHV